MGELNNRAFCINCGGIFPYYTVERTQVDTLSNGKTIEYSVTEAFCEECGEEVYVGELTDAQIEARWNALLRKVKEDGYV